jgi:hypothetical protein
VKRKWARKADEQKAVYANRRRIKGSYGKKLLKKRGELIERSFAHCYETGAMRRVYLRGRGSILKWQLIHVGAFNLSLIFRQTLGAGTPRELRNRQLLFTSLFGSGSRLKRSKLDQHASPNFRSHKAEKSSTLTFRIAAPEFWAVPPRAPSCANANPASPCTAEFAYRSPPAASFLLR